MMRDIPFNAEVHCVDGRAGWSSAVIIDPIQQKVTHIVVKDNHAPWAGGRLVPLERIEESNPEVIRLDCAKSELAKMEPFIAKHYVQKEAREYPTSFYGGEGPSYIKAYVFAAEVVPVEVERVPPGELAVHRSAEVRATDGWVGRVDEFLVDPASQQITHLVLREGHLWGQRELTVPISAIEQVSEETVYLNIDKQTVQSLPDVPVKREF